MVQISYTHTEDCHVQHGLFNSDTAEHFHCLDRDNEDDPSCDELFRTDLGYWILNRIDASANTTTFKTITNAEAKLWLNANGHLEAAARYFDRPKGGRPSKGQKVEVRVPSKDLTYIDGLCETWDMDRPEGIRRLLGLAIAHQKVAHWFEREQRIQHGIQQAKQGRTHDLGDFSQYLNEKQDR